MKPLTSHKATPLSGEITIPGDKSISHRSLMFGALAEGTTKITGLLEGEDVLHTGDAMREMGAEITKDDNGTWHVTGVGKNGLKQPAKTLEMGNSGTSTRLLLGLVSGYNITADFMGDASLSGRPMQRVITPLSSMGAKFRASNGDKLPLNVTGSDTLNPITYRLPVASAQVKSAILLAGLNADGETKVIEDKPTRDHTENMLRGFGVNVEINDLGNGASEINIKGGQSLTACDINIPADPSSAAFPACAACMINGSNVTLKNVGIGERRNGIYLCLQDMGADITFENTRKNGGEDIADIVIKGGKTLNAITVNPNRNASMIDEFPVFAALASCASGRTIMTDLGELRVKESDRLLMMAQGLKACGVDLEMGEDSLIINGNGKAPKGGATIETALDHRIAMAFMVLGTITQNPITIDDCAPIQTSFPTFIELMNGLGCDIKAEFAEL